ncbi:hypothetical protein D3C74_335300 [compost metagenome]
MRDLVFIDELFLLGAGENRVGLIVQDAHLLGLLNFVHAGPVRPNVEDAQQQREAEDAGDYASAGFF